MMDWLQNPQADYVIAAYGVALFLLIALGFVSWQQSRHAHKAWRHINISQRP